MGLLTVIIYLTTEQEGGKLMFLFILMGAVIGYYSDQYYTTKYGAGSQEAKNGKVKTAVVIVILAVLMSL